MLKTPDRASHESEPAAEDDSGKSDFIAAARRAARAAASDVSVVDNRADPANAGKKGSLLGSNRRPLLLAAGAILLAIMSVPLVRAILVNDPPAAELVTNAGEPAVMAPAAVEPVGETQPEIRVIDGSATAVAATGDTASADPAAPVAATARPEPETVSASVADEMPDPAGYAALTLADVPETAGPIALREAAAEGDPKALFVIGDRLTGAGPGAPGSDVAAAARWYEMAAELGFAPAQYRIGNFYEKGFGVERDLDTAKTWYQLAAEQGNASAMHNLAVLFATEIDGQRDMASAARWFLEAAELGVRDSQVNLGILSARGEGIEQNLVEAYKWLALAARAGDRDAEAKRDEVAGFMRPDQLDLARGTLELWQPKAVNQAANRFDIPAAWTTAKEMTAANPPLTDDDMTRAVRNIQAILNNNGFDAGTPDGVMGEQTRTAIIAFQKANGMLPTGEVDRALVDALLELNRNS